MPLYSQPVLIRERLVRVAESWLDIQPAEQTDVLRAQGADVVYFRESLHDIRDATHYHASSRHGVISLDQQPELLLESMNAGFRNEVRRAAREGIHSYIAQVNPFDDQFERELSDYIFFHSARGLAAMPRHNLEVYAKHGLLWSATAQIDQLPIRTHFYIGSAQESLLIASFPRTATSSAIKATAKGWANRRLHYDCIAYFHQAGCLRYNLGGIGNAGSSNNEDIIKFKMEMSPGISLRYTYARPLTAKGRLYLLARKFLKS